MNEVIVTSPEQAREKEEEEAEAKAEEGTETGPTHGLPWLGSAPDRNKRKEQGRLPLTSSLEKDFYDNAV